MRILRTVLSALAFLMAVVLAVVSSLYLLITPERVEHKLSVLASERWGVELRIHGRVDVKILPNLRVSIPESELVLADGEAIGGFDSARIQMNPLAFFARSPSIKELDVDGLSIRLNNRRDASHAFAPQGGWTIEKLSVAKASVYREDIGASFTDVYGAISDASESGGLLDASGRLNVDGRDYAVSIKTHYKFDSESATLVGTSVSGSGISDKSVEFSINAAAVNLDSTEAARLATLEYKNSNLGLLKIEAPKILSSKTFEIPTASISYAPQGENLVIEGSASASISKDLKEIVLSGASLRSTDGDVSFSGEMTAGTNGGSASLGGILFGTPAELSFAWGDSAAEKSSATSSELQAIMTQAYGSSAGTSSSRSDEYGEFFLDGAISLGELSLKPLVESAILRRAEYLPPSKFDLRISRAGRLSDVKAELLIRNGRIQLERLRAYIGSGSFEASANLDLKSSAWNAVFSASNAYGPIKGVPIDGAFSMFGEASGAAAEATDLKTIIESKGGCLSGISISSIQKDLLEDRADAPNGRKGFEASDKTLYSSFNAKLTLSRGVLSANAEVAGVDQWRMILEQSAPASSFKTLDGMLLLGSRGIEVPISFSIDSEAWSIDWKKAQESVTNLYGEEPWSMDNAARKIMRKFNSLKSDAQDWLNEAASSGDGESEEGESRAQDEDKSFIDSLLERAKQIFEGGKDAVLEWMGRRSEK